LREAACKSATSCGQCFEPLSPTASVTIEAREVTAVQERATMARPRGIVYTASLRVPICLPCSLDKIEHSPRLHHLRHLRRRGQDLYETPEWRRYRCLAAGGRCGCIGGDVSLARRLLPSAYAAASASAEGRTETGPGVRFRLMRPDCQRPPSFPPSRRPHQSMRVSEASSCRGRRLWLAAARGVRRRRLARKSRMAGWSKAQRAFRVNAPALGALPQRERPCLGSPISHIRVAPGRTRPALVAVATRRRSASERPVPQRPIMKPAPPPIHDGQPRRKATSEPLLGSVYLAVKSRLLAPKSRTAGSPQCSGILRIDFPKGHGNSA
jgi:hypothetical protein